MWEVRNAIMWEGGGGSIFERAEWNLNLCQLEVSRRFD